MRRNTISSILLTGAALAVAAPFALAQTAETKDSLEKKLQNQYPLTKLTADGKDVVTAGSVFTLKVDGLVLTPPDATDVSGNSYKAGKIIQSTTGKTNEKAKKIGSILGRIPVPHPGAADTATGSANATRTFVAGEKLNITKIEYKDGSVVFQVVSAKGYGDQNSIYYHGGLTFPVDKGSVPGADAMLAVTAEVFSVDPPDATKTDATPATQAASGAKVPDPGPAVAAPPQPVQPATPDPQPKYADIPPPPPPPAPTQELKLGLTVDQVVAQLGQPVTTAVAGEKQIYLFKDLKVTFVKGKVTDYAVR
jgi:hypothetical protein